MSRNVEESRARKIDRLHRRLERAKLTRKQIRCLAMFFFDGLSTPEIARDMGISQQAVSGHLDAGIQRLRKQDLRITRCASMPAAKVFSIDTETLEKFGPENLLGFW